MMFYLLEIHLENIHLKNKLIIDRGIWFDAADTDYYYWKVKKKNNC